ncbi:hypothetical protein [Sphaerochaeta halotolerans]|jgi:hypothetical protein|uniref:hypothetical protein n=1 Tax=Sphaerochaeta halotolerans TaxID=2293840 RepID=UPI0010588863|nr:hypothetical protein [Sphaerochaeta halotolerans]MXI87254.1 hypothetical protein [Sphaerochaeta halotolerans]
MKGINTPGQALDLGGVASFSAPRDGVSHLAFPALAPLGNQMMLDSRGSLSFSHSKANVSLYRISHYPRVRKTPSSMTYGAETP